MKERQEQLSGAVELAGGHMLREERRDFEGRGGRRDAVLCGGRVAGALHPASSPNPTPTQ